MNSLVGSATERSKNLLSGFTTGQKVMSVLAVAALALGALFFFQWASKPSYAPLYGGLSGADAAAISDVLTAEGITYQLADGGKSILVPQADLNKARVAVSSQGLPASGGAAASSCATDGGLGMSDKAQNEAFKRCLQTELEGMISSINGVQSANVTISIPERDVFATDQDKPTASAIITMQAGHTLESGKVAAITNMIAHSVPGMNAADVSVTDSNGRLLSGGGDQGIGMVGDHVAQTQAVEKEKQAQVQAMLDRILGPGNAVVNVAAELDFDQSTTKTQTYQPPTSTPISESISKEKYTGPGSGVGGIIGNGTTGATGSGNSNYTKETQTKNNVLNSTVEERTQTPGKIKRLNVAVLVNSDASANIAGFDPTQLKTNLESAVGLQATRGDTLQLNTVQFAKPAATPEQTSVLGTSLTDLIGRIGIVLVALLTVLLAFLNSRRNKKKNAELGGISEADAEWIEALRAEAIEAQRTGQLGGSSTAGALEGDSARRAIEASHEEEVNARLAMRKEITELVQRQPDEVAQLLRGWLADRRR